MTTQTRVPMWTKDELYRQMVKAGWQPGSVDGRFVHRETGRHIDMMSRDDDGILWIRWAVANATPSPF